MNCPSCQAENASSAGACTSCGTTLVPPTTVVVSVDLSTGAVFHGRYEILGFLGRGGMGMVYKARDRTLDEIVAIKVLRPDFAQDPRMAERFKGEIKHARKIRHRNVCAIHDFGEEKGLLYISMEFIEGVDLKHVLRERGGLPADEAYEVAIQIAEGLQAVHDAGIIHRDLKTPNIMRDGQGIARLMDFGIAKRQGAEGTMTATGQVVGTPEYMSPEQGQGHKVDFRSDIYAMGIVTYEIFTGHVPFRGETPISTILKHLQDPPPLEGPAAARIPPSLKPVLTRALSKDPVDRYDTARDFAEALRQARSPSRRQQPTPTVALEAPTLTAGTPSGAWTTRRTAVLGALAVVALLGVVLGSGLWRSREVSVTPAGGPPTPRPSASAPSPILPPASPDLGSPGPASVTLASPAAGPPAIRAGATDRVATPASPPPRRTVSSAPFLPAPTLRPVAPPTPVASSPVAPPPAQPTATPPIVEVGDGFLQVAVRPWAEVTVDGNLVGTTPIDRIKLSAGSHEVRLRQPAYEPYVVRLTVRAGQTERLIVDLATQGTRRP